MKKLLPLAITVIALSVLLFTGCSGEQTFIDPAEKITTSVDKEFLIAVDSNPASGLLWEVSYDSSAVSLEYEEYNAEKCPGLVGAGGTQYYGFKALKKGETTITMDYTGPMLANPADQRVFRIDIR